MNRQEIGAASTRKRADASMRKFVRITGSRLGRYVEFEFSVNDQDLTVELILPFGAFNEFCELQNATVLPPAPEVADELERQAWRSRQPGLLRRVKDAASAQDDAAARQEAAAGEGEEGDR